MTLRVLSYPKRKSRSRTQERRSPIRCQSIPLDFTPRLIYCRASTSSRSAVPGFSSEVQSGITLTVGAQQVLNMVMKMGQFREKVEVTAEAPAVQLATSIIGGMVNQDAVAQLPLNGRDWTQLATLQPGVDSVSSIQANTGSKDRARRGLRSADDHLRFAPARKTITASTVSA